MKTHSTNYKNTFIEIAEDCPIHAGEIPPVKDGKTSIANIQFEMLHQNPYRYTSDDVLFSAFALRQGFQKNEWNEQRKRYFSKGQPCFRSSPLTKRYGFGIHHDENGKIAMYGAETEEYDQFVIDKSLKKVKAMRSKKV